LFTVAADSGSQTAEDKIMTDEIIIVADNKKIPIPDRLVGLVDWPSKGEEDTHLLTASPHDNSTRRKMTSSRKLHVVFKSNIIIDLDGTIGQGLKTR